MTNLIFRAGDQVTVRDGTHAGAGVAVAPLDDHPRFYLVQVDRHGRPQQKVIHRCDLDPTS